MENEHTEDDLPKRSPCQIATASPPVIADGCVVYFESFPRWHDLNGKSFVAKALKKRLAARP